MVIKYLMVFTFLLSAEYSMAQKAELVSLEKLQRMIESPDHPIQVINFWATWCAPCVKEIPLFEKLNLDRKDVKVTLVSMDVDLDPNPEKVYKFIARKKIRSNVIILNARDPNSWIDKIDKSWSGSLPATLIVNNTTGKRKFIEHELHDGDLERWLAELK